MSLGYGKGQEDVFLLLWFLSPTWIWLHLRMGLFFLAVRRISVCLTVTFPVILFLSPCKQPLKAWCTLRNNLRHSILTSHWKTINCPISPSFRAKWEVTPNVLITQDNCRWKSTSRPWCPVRLRMLHSCPLLLCLSIHACGSYRCCVWSIHVKNRAEIWKLLLWIATTSCLWWDGIRS